MPNSSTDGDPFFIVMNPASGNDDAGDRRARLAQLLEAAGRRFEFVEFAEGQALAQVALSAAQRARTQHGTLVACGGDGTINAVAAAALAEGVPLGVIPQGTFNYFGRAYGISSDLEQAVTCMLSSAPQAVAVGLVNQKLFVVNASIGMYPQVLEDRETWQQSLGRHRLVAIVAGVVTMMREHRMLSLRVDDGKTPTQVRTATLVVCNNPIQLARLGIAGADAAGNGELVAISLAPISKWGLLRLIATGAIGQLGASEEVRTQRCTHLIADFSARGIRRRKKARRIKVAIDGEIIRLPMPLIFETSPKPLMLRAPQAASAEADPG